MTMAVTTHDRQGRTHTRPFAFVNRLQGHEDAIGITVVDAGSQTLANARATHTLAVDGHPLTVTDIKPAHVIFAKTAAFVAGIRAQFARGSRP